MLNSIKSILAFLRIKPTRIDSDFVKTEQQDTRDQQAIKRVNKAFDQQQELIQMRALKPHAAECEDTLMCTKDDCWTFVPDKIVRDSYVVEELFNVKSAQKDKKVVKTGTKKVIRTLRTNKRATTVNADQRS